MADKSKKQLDPLVLKMKDRRKEKGISQLKTALMLGVTVNAVTFWETGKTSPTRRNRARITKWLEGETFEGKKFKSMAFAVKVRRMRLERRMTLSEFSRSLGMGTTTIYNWENGISKPSELHMQSLKEWQEDNPVLGD